MISSELNPTMMCTLNSLKSTFENHFETVKKVTQAISPNRSKQVVCAFWLVE